MDTRWGGLSQLEQNNPVNKAKYQTAKAALSRAGEILSAADAAGSTISTSTVQYSMDKRIKDAMGNVLTLPTGAARARTHTRRERERER